ncbi:succinyl-ligase beta-chain [Stylonychia lemnae]|uniref:Succinyl-CoA synthetase beta chain n=1 Tax=Stylonychia lemnae TaxID=5949 RepID=A0A078B4J6_STYLE|nr:succinyl-ligase beta-chain [Stylonychia lemnae]|eukprot:CDW89196.1 succinyl-ligase beta-chain [Stylonychia lemnae]
MRMRLHEYQAAQLMLKYRIPVPLIQASGRNNGYFKENAFQGGNHIVSTPEEVQEYARQMCGKTLVCPESGKQGFLCRCVYILEELAIYKELYVCVTYDRNQQCPVIIYSDEGGTNLHEAQEKRPEKFHKIYVDFQKGLDVQLLSQVATELGIAEKKSEMIFLLKHLYDCFIQRDAEMIEINPLVYTKDQKIVAADTKVIIDDSALFRQAELKEEEDRTQVNFKERIAHTYNLQYIHIGGNIGILANGAGLAMATCDIIKLYGGEPSNFLDTGGGASHEQIAESIKLLETDVEVSTIFINIFGGIMKCDMIAQSIIRATEELNTKKPIVLRLKGNNSELARNMIKGREEQLGIYFCETMDQAAELAVDLAKKEKVEEQKLEIEKL